ncbi:hypothetical protein [Rhizobium sp. SSA_523]|uniref:hypothetical protein n=1 Tax=Rhizobium sp. SSA_523 TaxID=2952477 RepID=UPI0020911366|nr:hypothetical protein [Rhizobium sp. SSA_523]MCO5730129.1 hypothetical protein [Rhizobium sp. SSA_523]WKC25193.1 hypothetical protein QTJ18_14500 [Rhizobium sp. SSA_523]
MAADRTPCINPRCKRTAPADQFPGEMICGKCFRNLPAEVRADHRRFWREIRKWDRRIAKTNDELKLERMRSIRQMWNRRLNHHWDTVIKPAVVDSEKPEGLNAFLEELGL